MEASHLAVQLAEDRARGSVMASDAFFPFPDGLEVGIRAGVTAVIQPGGSLKDADVVAAADAAGLAVGVPGRRPLQTFSRCCAPSGGEGAGFFSGPLSKCPGSPASRTESA